MIGDFMFGKVISAPISCQMHGPTVHWCYGVQVSSSSQHTYMLLYSTTYRNSSSSQMLKIPILEYEAAGTVSGGINNHVWEKHQ